MFLPVLIGVFLVSAVVAVVASETQRKRLLIVTKPLTTLLLFAIVGWPESSLAWKVTIGILFSLGGDVALLFDGKRAFMFGLALFLGAHASYIAAFSHVDAGSTGAVVYAILIAITTGLTLRKVWPGAAGIRVPLIIYATLLSTMAITAFATMGGPLPITATRLAAGGGLLFYIADSSLALTTFAKPIKHASVLTIGVYWIGQLGIAVAARSL
jgi:uncharacterized membrane protein YhhN